MPGFKGDVWNPTTGCTRVSAGCDNCYAFELHDKRFKGQLAAAEVFFRSNDNGVRPDRLVDVPAAARAQGAALPLAKQYDLPFSRVQMLEDRVDAPLHRRTPTCYFVDSMADLFHEDVPDEFLLRVWRAMAGCARHRFLILTKRPERMRAWAERYDPAIFDNIWLGTSVEDQRSADERIPHLLATPAAVRFLSCEPLLAPIDIARWSWGNRCPDRQCGDSTWDHDCELGEQRLHWVIVGGESGPRARPMDLAWARSLRAQCAAAGVSFFMKQAGSLVVSSEEHAFNDWASGNTATFRGDLGAWTLRPRESHGRDPDEWPIDLRVRTWPQ